MPYERTRNSHDDVVVFATPPKRRVRSVAFAAFSGGALLAISFVAAATVYIVIAWVFGGPVAGAITAAAPVGVLGVYMTWKILVAMLRFHVAAGRDTVTMGSGFLRRSFRCPMVETISLPDDKREHGVAMEGDGYRAVVYLSPTDEDQCVAVLRRRCENALFIDRAGREHLPRAASRPSLTLSAYYRRLRLKVWCGIWAVTVLSIACVASGNSVLDQLLQQRPKRDLFDFARTCAFLISCIVGLLGFIRYAYVHWKKMRVIGEKLSVARANEQTTDRD
jgi:hypothetical protein